MGSFVAVFILENWAFDSGAPSTVPDPSWIAISLVKYASSVITMPGVKVFQLSFWLVDLLQTGPGNSRPTDAKPPIRHDTDV